jgi:hypothetical protein
VLAVVGFVGGCLLVSAGSAQGAIYPWTGTWDTQYGTMQLTQDGTRVTGTYGYAPDAQRGKIDGMVSGATLRGTWDARESGGATEFGTIEWVMSADGGRFDGSWVREGTTEGGSWNGTRTSALPPPVAPGPLESEAEPPSPGPDSGLARLIRRFQDQVEADLKLPLYRVRGRALWTHGDDFQAALRRITPRNAAESKAKACALRAGFHWEYHGRQLHNVYTAMRWGNSRLVARYKRAAAEHLVEANRELKCALAYLPARPDPDPPPTRGEGDSATIGAFHARDPNIRTNVTPGDVVLAGGTMTNCFATNTVYVRSSVELVAGSRLTTTWRLPNGQSKSSEEAEGPRAGDLVGSVFYVDGSPLPNGVYKYELRTQNGLLARASFTRRCS